MQKMFSTHSQMSVVEGHNIFNQFTVVGTLGTGNSTVYSVLKNGEKDELAMKEIVIKNDQNLMDFMKEVNLMKQISTHKHPNIIGFHDYCILLREGEYEDTRLAYMLFEKAITSLDKLIQLRQSKNQYYPPEVVRKFLQKVINVHKFLQEQKIAHCDIKPENILITKIDTLDFKVCDIGSGKLIKNEHTSTATIGGTIPFLSPELMSNLASSRVNHNPFKSDVYSLGLCTLYLITFRKFTQAQRCSLSEGPFKDVLDEWIRLANVVSQTDSLVTKLLKEMLTYDERNRPDFFKLQEIMETTILSQFSQSEEAISTPTPKLLTEDCFGSYQIPEIPIIIPGTPITQHMSKTRSNFSRSTLAKYSKNSQSTSNMLTIPRQIDALPKQIDQSNIFRIQQTATFRKPNLANRLPELKQNSVCQYSPSRQIKVSNVSSVKSVNFMIEDSFQLQVFQSPMKTSTLVDSGRQIRRKGNSNANLKLAPLDLQLQLKTSYTTSESPKKLAHTLNNDCIVTTMEGFKRFIEEENHTKLILLLCEDQSEMINDLPRVQFIKDLSIVIKNSTNHRIQKVIQALKDFDCLVNLELIITGTPIVGTFPNLIINTLKTLTIKIKNCESVSLTNLMGCLIFNNYQHLTIHFNRVMIKDIDPLLALITKNSQLIYVDLSFSYGSLDDKQHKKLYEVLSQCNALKTLIVKFKNYELALKQAQWVFNSNLRDVVLKYEKSQLDQALTSLALGLQKLSKIHSLEIDLSYMQTQPQILKLLFDYIKKLQTLKELRLNLNGISLSDNSIIPFMVDKFKMITSLEIFQFSCTQSNNRTIEILFSLVSALKPSKKLCQFEVIVPRLQSVQSIIDTAPMETLCTFQDVTNLKINVFDQKLIESRLEYYNLDPHNYCSDNDFLPLFQCLSCKPIPAFDLDLCLQCARSCHLGHKIVFSQVIPRITGQFSRLKQCQCYSKGCNSSKNLACQNIFGQITSYERECETCSTQHFCYYCAINSHSGHKIQCKDYLTTYQCSK